MSASHRGGPEWARLGELLRQRRVEMDPRWRDLTLFAGERGLNWRLAWDIEENRRTSYRPITLSAIEVAYGWQPGSIRAVLAGGDPVQAAQVPARILALVESAWGSLADAPQHVREFARDERWDEQFRLEWISNYARQNKPQGNPGSTGRLREA
jgi:hypothetical protein